MDARTTSSFAARRTPGRSGPEGRRGLVVLALLAAAVALLVLGISVGRLVGGDWSGAAAGAPVVLLLGLLLAAACARRGQDLRDDTETAGDGHR